MYVYIQVEFKYGSGNLLEEAKDRQGRGNKYLYDHLDR